MQSHFVFAVDFRTISNNIFQLSYELHCFFFAITINLKYNLKL